MRNRWLALLLVVVFIFSITGCSDPTQRKNSQGSKSTTSTENSFKEGKYYATGDKEIEITWLMRDDEQESLNVSGKFFDDVYKQTGVKIKAQPVLTKDLGNQINLAIASHNMPDIIQGNDGNVGDFLKYGMEGAFLPVGDIIEKYAPHIKAKLFDDPRYIEARMWSTAVDGKQYVIPSLRNSQGFGQHLSIRSDLLEKYNIPMPTTIDELYNFMKVVQTGESKEMAKDGKKFYAFGTPENVDFMKYMFFSFDVSKEMVVENGKVFFGPADPRYEQALKWLNNLYTEGLMPQEIFSLSENQYYEMYYNGRIGVGLNSLARIKKANEAFDKIYKPKGKNYHMVLLPPLKSKAGNVYPNTEPFQKQPIVISAETKYPVECVRLLDWFFTDEGFLLATKSLGLKEGTGSKDVAKEFYTDYKAVKEKYPDWYNQQLGVLKKDIADGIPDADKKLTKDGEVAGYFYWPGPDELKARNQYGDFLQQCPAGIDVIINDLSVSPVADMDETRKAILYLTKNFPEPINPLVTSLGSYPFRFVHFTEDELKRTGDLTGDITTTVDEYMAKFITGKIGFDQWDKYVSMLKAQGMDEYVQIYNSGYQKYIKPLKK